MKLRVPRVIWVAWCHTCGSWLDETEDHKASAKLARSEHPEHFPGDPGWPCRVEVIPFRADRKNARQVTPRRGGGT